MKTLLVLLLAIAVPASACLLRPLGRAIGADKGARADKRPSARPEAGGSHGAVRFLLAEMRRDQIAPAKIESARARLESAIASKDKKKVEQAMISTVEDAYGLKMWQPVSFSSSDGLRIPGRLTLPRAKGRAAGLVLVHGGQHGNSSIYLRHAFLFGKNGYATLAVDYRSSGGHGDALRNADDPDPAGGEVEDVLAAVSYLRSRPQVDSGRIGIFGGSRGAYLGANVVERTRVQAAVLNFGGYDANVLLGSGFGTPEQRTELEHYVAELGEPMDEFLHARSPVNFPKKVSAPILLIHGTSDTVVPASESRNFSEALNAAGKLHKLKFYPGEPHGFVFKNTPAARDAFGISLEFLNSHLRKEGRS